ncbi:HNH endonuclease [Brachybacterium sp. Z12]|uniref:HNH endonuclease n=1 Tax=Brachybacterium sp. Z12 TaxID=2759167 RepID=UPI0018626718|nr:HNH endonuclease [Brachybacterium sp. Z12]QNN81622.1 HNH endonuclease [Brachybacterium sp. Z12]
MTDWLIASDGAKFDVNRAFSERTVVDWSETSSAHIHDGDRVFLYQVKPVQTITHVCEVVQTGIESDDMLDDREFWIDAAAFEERLKRTWMRLSLLHTVPPALRGELSLERLLDAGLNGAPQGRRRAPVGVTELVTEVLDAAQPDSSELIRRERDLIADLGIERSPWRFKRGRRGGTRSLESFSYALSMPDAPTALAMLRAYLTAAGLDRSEGWGVSAMPSWAGPTDHQRFATISGGGIELFYVWFESASGLVTEWGARFPADLATQLPESEHMWLSTADNGDTGVHGATLDDLIAALDDPEFLDALTATSEARATSRRADWHNPYLGSLLGTSGAPVEEESEPVKDEDVEFERRYIERVTKHRLHQAPLREAALRRYGARCMYCGLDVEQVLEAAHVIPDSKGGAASTDNIRILCANHHTALDAGLLRVTAEGDVVPAPGAPSVPPSPDQGGAP